jgi:hypothetical protein
VAMVNRMWELVEEGFELLDGAEGHFGNLGLRADFGRHSSRIERIIAPLNKYIL